MTVEPKKAASCIVLRGSEVLLARRNAALRFMPNHHVFPGGRIEEGEAADHVQGAVDDVQAQALQAAVREVFEETGLLCVRGELPDAADARSARIALLNGETTFAEILSRFSLSIDAGEFESAGLWVTPRFSKVRFHTQFFLHQMRADQREEVIEGEIVDLHWVEPREARRRWHRGEIRLSTPTAYVLQQLAKAEPPEALRFLVRGPGRDPAEHSRYEIRCGITLVPLDTQTIPPATQTNCLVIGDEELFVIDPGADQAGELEHLAFQLDHLIELGSKLSAIVLTHSHPDHTAGVGYLRERYRVPVFAHRLTEEQVSFPVDRHLDDGDLLVCQGDVELRLRAIHTPGHDPGHLCFLEETTGALLAGDMIANPGTIVVSEQYRGDMAEYMRSLEKLMEFDSKLIVPAHGAPMGQPKQRLQELLDHRLWRELKIQDAYEAGACRMDDLLKQAYDDVPEVALALARHSLQAHLTKLGIKLES